MFIKCSTRKCHFWSPSKPVHTHHASNFSYIEVVDLSSPSTRIRAKGTTSYPNSLPLGASSHCSASVSLLWEVLGEDLWLSQWYLLCQLLFPLREKVMDQTAAPHWFYQELCTIHWVSFFLPQDYFLLQEHKMIYLLWLRKSFVKVLYKQLPQLTDFAIG